MLGAIETDYLVAFKAICQEVSGVARAATQVNYQFRMKALPRREAKALDDPAYTSAITSSRRVASSLSPKR